MGYYWEVENKQTGEVKQIGVPLDCEAEAIEHAKDFIKKGRELGTFIIKVFTQSPDERWYAAPPSEPVSSEELNIGARWYVVIDWGEPAGRDKPEGFASIDDALQRAKSMLVNNEYLFTVQGGGVEIYPREVD